MDRERVAWAAGLFDGGGTITRLRGARPRLAVSLTDEGLVRGFAAVVEAGKVYGPYGPYRSSLGDLPRYYWCADGDAALAVARLLRPWLGSASLDKLELLFGSAFET